MKEMKILLNPEKGQVVVSTEENGVVHEKEIEPEQLARMISRVSGTTSYSSGLLPPVLFQWKWAAPGRESRFFTRIDSRISPIWRKSMHTFPCLVSCSIFGWIWTER